MPNPNIHTDLISKDGEISDMPFSTFYNHCAQLIQADGYIRVIQVREGHNYETRIDAGALMALGWVATARVTVGDAICIEPL